MDRPQTVLLVGGPADLTRLAITPSQHRIEVPYFNGNVRPQPSYSDCNYRNVGSYQQEYGTATYVERFQRTERFGRIVERIFIWEADR